MDEKIMDMLHDKPSRKRFAFGVFRIFDKFLVICLLGFICFQVVTMEEQKREHKLDYVKGLFGFGDRQKALEREEKRLAEAELEKNLYKQLEMLKSMNTQYQQSLPGD